VTATDRSAFRWSRVSLQVLGCGTESSSVVVEQPEAGVAAAAKHAAYHTGAVAMVDRRATDTARARDGLSGTADCAVGGVEPQGLSPLVFFGVMSKATLQSEAVTAERPERGRVRTPVTVLGGEDDIASGTVRARDSHCPILPAQKGSWGGNAVTPNAAEVILCALVEAITGAEIERHTTGLAVAA
jgi:hypothetical protein